VLHDVQVSTDDPQLPPKQEKTFVKPDGGAEHVFSYDCADKDVTLGPFHPDQGWSIDPGTINVTKSYPKGDQRSTVKLVESSAGAVSVNIKTTAACAFGISKGSGDVYVSVSYTEYYQPPKPPKTTTETPITADLTPLTWGGTVIHGVTENRWRLDAVLFDNTAVSYNGTDVTNPYLAVRYQQGSRTVNVSAVSASSLADSFTVKP
jgi:hypothetical protein